MLLAIFGAGASHDSYESILPSREQWRPPLAADLFDEAYTAIIGNNPSIRDLVHPLRRLATRSGALEEHLEKLQADDNPDVTKSRLALRYYLRQLMVSVSGQWIARTGGATNYATLVSQIIAWQYRTGKAATVVTFNYDTLIDQACVDRGLLDMAKIESYASTRFSLVKIHGSSLWWRRIEGPQGKERQIAGASAVRPLDLILSDEEKEAREAAIGGAQPDRGWIPAIAIPTLTKAEFECPPEHVEAARRGMTEASHLLVVGWRGFEKTFMTMWRTALKGGPSNNLAFCQVVDGSVKDAQTVRDILNGSGIAPNTKDYLLAAGFSNWLKSGGAETFFGLG